MPSTFNSKTAVARAKPRNTRNQNLLRAHMQIFSDTRTFRRRDNFGCPSWACDSCGYFFCEHMWISFHSQKHRVLIFISRCCCIRTDVKPCTCVQPGVETGQLVCRRRFIARQRLHKHGNMLVRAYCLLLCAFFVGGPTGRRGCLAFWNGFAESEGTFTRRHWCNLLCLGNNKWHSKKDLSSEEGT